MNQLIHIDEFREVLANYRLSEEAKRVLAALNLVILVGPTASGKNTIINELLKTGHYHYLVSDTTREPRVNDGIPEENGKAYWFKSEEEMLRALRDGQFLEAALIHEQQVSGTSMRELAVALEAHKTALAEIEIVGAHKAHIAKPDSIIIFNVPPSFDIWLQRLTGRSNMPPEEVRRRLETAVSEYEAALMHDYYRFVINDDIAATVKAIDAMARLDAHDTSKEYAAHELVKQLLQQTNEFLQSQA